MACCVCHTSCLCPKEFVPGDDDICRKRNNVSRSDGVTSLGDQSHERSENCPMETMARVVGCPHSVTPVAPGV